MNWSEVLQLIQHSHMGITQSFKHARIHENVFRFDPTVELPHTGKVQMKVAISEIGTHPFLGFVIPMSFSLHFED